MEGFQPESYSMFEPKFSFFQVLCGSSVYRFRPTYEVINWLFPFDGRTDFLNLGYWGSSSRDSAAPQAF